MNKITSKNSCLCQLLTLPCSITVKQTSEYATKEATKSHALQITTYQNAVGTLCLDCPWAVWVASHPVFYPSLVDRLCSEQPWSTAYVYVSAHLQYAFAKIKIKIIFFY